MIKRDIVIGDYFDILIMSKYNMYNGKLYTSWFELDSTDVVYVGGNMYINFNSEFYIL